jgi:hypothetical protein
MHLRHLKPRTLFWLGLVLLTIAVGGSGCGTTADEPDNASSKPWDSPEGWQNGMLPSTMFQH